MTFGPATASARELHPRDVVQAHRRGRRHEHRHGRRRQRHPADHEGPGRSRDARQPQHELLPRHRRHDRRPRRRLRGHGRPARNHPVAGTTAVRPAMSGTTPPRPTTARPGTCTSTATSTRRSPSAPSRPSRRASSTPRSARAMTSTGAAAGFFQGVVDEARIWNVARSQAQIQAAKDTDIAAPQTGLIGHWGLNEGAGAIANNTFGTADVNGTLTASPTWVSGLRAGCPELRAPAQRHEPVRDVRSGDGPRRNELHPRAVVQAHRRGRRHEHRHGRRRECHPPDHEGPGRSRDAGQRSTWTTSSASTRRRGVLVGDFEDTATAGQPPGRRDDRGHQQCLAPRRRDVRRHDLEPVSRRQPRQDARRRRLRRPSRRASSTPGSAPR